MCCIENWILQQSSKTSQFKKTKYMQGEIMPDKFATCTVKHIFKKQLPKKKRLIIQSHPSFSHDPLLSVLVKVVCCPSIAKF